MEDNISRFIQGQDGSTVSEKLSSMIAPAKWRAPQEVHKAMAKKLQMTDAVFYAARRHELGKKTPAFFAPIPKIITTKV